MERPARVRTPDDPADMFPRRVTRARRRAVLACAACLSAAALSACDGDSPVRVESDAGSDGGVADAASDAAAGPEYPDVAFGEVSIRRLTRTQYANAVRDVFGERVVVPEVSEPDVAIGGLLSVGASGATYTARGVESLEEAAFAVADQALDDVEVRARLVPCEPAGAVDPECASAAVAAIGLRVWRRPLDDEELGRIAAIAIEAAEVLGDFHDGLEYGIAALLQSPNFLFRVELGEVEPGEAEGAPRRLTDWELATRLAFFLWNSTPDAELLAAADSGALSTDDGLRAQAERLLASERSRAGMRNFFSEYLRLYELDELRKDPTVFEHFSTRLGVDAREETLRLLEHIVFDVDGDYRDVVTTRTTFMNPRLATLYAIPAPAAEGFAEVRLPVGGGRVGLLGHASFLNLHAHTVSSSATRRGVAVRQILLCHAIPSPPVDVDTSIPEPSGEAPTLRDRVAEHLENDACAACHELTDPIGLALENFDGIGRWRDTDNGHAIDASGWLDEAAYDDAVGLASAIREHPDFAACLVRMLTRYATGRVETWQERRLLDVLSTRFAALGYRVEPLLIELVMSPQFRLSGEPR